MSLAFRPLIGFLTAPAAALAAAQSQSACSPATSQLAIWR
jgi:hypothetical protein